MLAGNPVFTLSFFVKIRLSNVYFLVLVRCKLRKLSLILKFPKDILHRIDAGFNLLIQQCVARIYQNRPNLELQQTSILKNTGKQVDLKNS
jgi:hypothetical protein